MGYCFMTFAKLRTNEALSDCMEHIFRKDAVLDADSEKGCLCKELVRLQDENYVVAVDRLVYASPAYKTGSLRKDAVRALEFMLAYTGKMDEACLDQDKWEQKNVEWLVNTFGEENIVSVMRHYDETTPHIHALVVPMVNGRLNCSHYIGGKQNCEDLRGGYAEVMKEFCESVG